MFCLTVRQVIVLGFALTSGICALWDLLLFSLYIMARPVANSALPPLLRDIAGAGIESKQLLQYSDVKKNEIMPTAAT